MKNVIDLTERLKSQSRTTADLSSRGVAPIIDMTEMRHAMIARERRQTKRTILEDFIGAFVLVPKKGLLKISLYDISERGLAFDLGDEAGQFAVGEELAIRVYLNQRSYFAFTAKVKNVRAVEDERSYRHGADFSLSSSENETLRHFVRFVESVSTHLQSDSGDLQVSGSVR